MPGHFWTMTIWCPQCYWLVFSLPVFLDIFQIRCSGTQGILWIALLKDHLKQAAIDFVLVVHSELEHSYLSTRHVGCPCVRFSTLLNGFFYRRKKQNFILQGTRFYSMTFTAGSSQPINTTSWDEQNRLFCHGLLVKPPWIIDPNWIPIQPHEILFKSN